MTSIIIEIANAIKYVLSYYVNEYFRFMKTAIIILILLSSNFIFACDNSLSAECNDVQIEINELKAKGEYEKDNANSCEGYIVCRYNP